MANGEKYRIQNRPQQPHCARNLENLHVPSASFQWPPAETFKPSNDWQVLAGGQAAISLHLSSGKPSPPTCHRQGKLLNYLYCPSIGVHQCASQTLIWPETFASHHASQQISGLHCTGKLRSLSDFFWRRALWQDLLGKQLRQEADSQWNVGHCKVKAAKCNS